MSEAQHKHVIPTEKIDCNKLVAHLYRCEPLSTLEKNQVPVLISLSSVEKYSAGAPLYDGDIPDEVMIYLLKGSLQIVQPGAESDATLEAGTDAALCVISKKNFADASITTVTEVELIRIEKELFETLIAWGQISAPETEVVMSEDGIVTIDRASWLNSMIKSPTFRSLPAANIEQLLNKLEPIRVNAGDLIIRQGDVGDYFYMINNGAVMVTISPEKEEDTIIMAELGEGGSFGEAALISDKPRNASITMLEDGVLLRLSKEDFINLLKQPTLRWVEYEKGLSIVKHGAMWIDVRLQKEYEHGHLEGAINIPMRELHRLARNLKGDIPYICYCETGTRSSAAAFALSQYDLRIAVLKGGISTVAEEQIVVTPARV